MSTTQLSIHPEPSPYAIHHPEPLPYERRESRRRSSERVRLITQVESKTACDVNSLGHSENISSGGLLVATRDTIEPRTMVIVRFHLPSRTRANFIETVGEVVRERPAESMGIRFLNLSFWDRKAIEEFVQRAEETDA